MLLSKTIYGGGFEFGISYNMVSVNPRLIFALTMSKNMYSSMLGLTIHLYWPL